MSGLEPLNADPRGQWRPERPPPTADNLPLHDEETDVYEALLDLVDGRTHFDIEDSDEFIEGAIVGLDRRIVSKLRRGAYAIKAHLDLHGLTREDARDAVERFLAECQIANQRAVLIVHGRGLNSQDNIPVLKGLLRSWLERGRIAKRVLAFATARPHDGGAGAVYVLLRRMRTER
ncbi:MAG: Smr/MutS family protein [Deltaproteobacteria bacterium]|nr:Smr/MutS family protein [Deltaproteobacteria bacterium]